MRWQASLKLGLAAIVAAAAWRVATPAWRARARGRIGERAAAAPLPIDFARWAAREPAAACGQLLPDDPDLVVQLAGILPDGSIPLPVIFQAVSAFARTDPAAAGQWVEGIPPGDTRDEALRAYSCVLAPSDPAAALAWAMKIADKDIRRIVAEPLQRQR